MGNSTSKLIPIPIAKKPKITYIAHNNEMVVQKKFHTRESFNNEIRVYLIFGSKDFVLRPIIYNYSSLTLILPYIEYDLFHVVNYKIFDRSLLFDLYHQLLSGVKVMHLHGMEHNDLKLENCLVDPSQKLFIIDFEMTSFQHGENETNRRSGTITYMPPECLGYMEEYEFGKKDVWALGVIYCLCFFDFYPVEKPTLEGYSYFLNNRLFDLPLVIQKCFHPNARERCDVDFLLAEFSSLVF